MEDLNTKMSETADNLKGFMERQDERAKNFEEKMNENSARLLDIEQMYARIPSGSRKRMGGKSGVVDRFVQSDQIAAMTKGAPTTGRVELDDVSIKSITNIGAGSDTDTDHDVQPNRSARIWNDPRRGLSLLDVMPSIQVSSAKFEYLQLSGYSNAAAFQEEEGGQKAETDYPTELAEANVATIAHWVRASTQILADAPVLTQQINSLLAYGLLAKLEAEIVTGAGGKGKILGLLDQATPYTATATAPADQIGEAITELDSQGWAANVVVMNPRDWFSIASARATDEQYILGSPRNPAPPSLWGIPVVGTPSLGVGTALVVDTSQVALLDRQSATLLASREDGTNFTSNLVTLLAEMRAGLAVFSTGAVLSVDISPAE